MRCILATWEVLVGRDTEVGWISTQKSLLDELLQVKSVSYICAPWVCCCHLYIESTDFLCKSMHAFKAKQRIYVHTGRGIPDTTLKSGMTRLGSWLAVVLNALFSISLGTSLLSEILTTLHSMHSESICPASSWLQSITICIIIYALGTEKYMHILYRLIYIQTNMLVKHIMVYLLTYFGIATFIHFTSTFMYMYICEHTSYI